MTYQEIKTNNKYLNHFIEAGLDKHFGLSLASVQTEVLKAMLTHDYVLFRHGRSVGATFLLAVLAAILRKINPDINIVIASATVRQARMINSEFEQKFKRQNEKLLNVVSIEEALSGKYEVVLLDEITHLPIEHIESLIKHIDNRSISKIIAVCNGYRSYFPIAKLENTLYKGSMNPDNNRKVVVKNYEDMPTGFFDLDSIEKAKKVFNHPEEFNMEYKGYII